MTACIASHAETKAVIFLAFPSLFRAAARATSAGAFLGLVGLVGLVTGMGSAQAADHFDAPGRAMDATTDLSDTYAWMSPDAQSLNVVMTIGGRSFSDATFSDAILYSAHIASQPALGEEATEHRLTCRFFGEANYECWLDDARYAVGTENEEAETNGEGFRVYAGLRNDPFFLWPTAYYGARGAFFNVREDQTPMASGCTAVPDGPETILPIMDAGTTNDDGTVTPPGNAFATFNNLAIVAQIDVSLLNEGGSLLSVWTSINQKK